MFDRRQAQGKRAGRPPTFPDGGAGVPRGAGPHWSWHEDREGQGLRSSQPSGGRRGSRAPAGSPGSQGPLTPVLLPSAWLSRAPSPLHAFFPGDRHCPGPGSPAFTLTRPRGRLERVGGHPAVLSARRRSGPVRLHLVTAAGPHVGSWDPSAGIASPLSAHPGHSLSWKYPSTQNCKVPPGLHGAPRHICGRRPGQAPWTVRTQGQAEPVSTAGPPHSRGDSGHRQGLLEFHLHFDWGVGMMEDGCLYAGTTSWWPQGTSGSLSAAATVIPGGMSCLSEEKGKKVRLAASYPRAHPAATSRWDSCRALPEPPCPASPQPASLPSRTGWGTHWGGSHHRAVNRQELGSCAARPRLSSGVWAG